MGAGFAYIFRAQSEMSSKGRGKESLMSVAGSFGDPSYANPLVFEQSQRVLHAAADREIKDLRK